MKVVRIVCCFCLLLVGVLAISPSYTLLAQEEGEEEKMEERLEMLTTYPKVEVISGETAEFEVELTCIAEIAEEPLIFDLSATGPKDWYVYMTPSYPKDRRIASIGIKPAPAGYRSPDKIRVVAVPAYWLMPEAGEYKIILEGSSGDIVGSYELTVVVTATYILNITPSAERYSTSATAGKDNYFSIKIQNNGSATTDDITFSSSKSAGWLIEFSPDKIDSLDAGGSQTIGVNIKPAERTIAGDYLVTLSAEGRQASAEELSIRVTVETSSIWGWVGVGIILLVIAGIVFIFMRFSRR